MRQLAAELETLAAVRDQIDEIDGELLVLLAERSAHIDRATVLKGPVGVAAAAPTRYGAVIAAVRARADAVGFDPDVAEAMWRVMIDAFIAREEQVLGTDGVDE